MAKHSKYRPTAEELARIGAKSEAVVRLDKDADPTCPKCKGTGQIETPNRLRGGHVCPCTLNKRK